MDPGYEMLFETTIRTFLGDKAYHIAGQVHTEKYRKEWYRKALKKIITKVQDIDTSTKHKEQLAHWSERALDVLGERNFRETEFSLYLLRLTGALLGFVGVRGVNIATPMYYQTPNQHYTEVIISGGDVMQDYHDQKSSVSVRKKLVAQLKEEGLNDFQISLVLNTSEYQVKKLKNEL
jgi:hypothetical protein